MSSAGQSSRPRKNQGRRKVNMAKTENKSSLQATFSKQTLGLFKKASDLCTLTGVEAGLVVLSPGDKAHSFGHPDINTIADRSLAQNSPPVNASNRHMHVQQSSNPTEKEDDVEYLAWIEKQIEVEKARLDQVRKIDDAAMGELNYEQLKVLRGKVMEFGKNLNTKMELRSSIVPGTYPRSGGSSPVVADPGQHFDSVRTLDSSLSLTLSLIGMGGA